MLFDQVNREMDLCIRHLVVLNKVVEDGPIGILKLAEETDMATHKVRYSLRVLEQQGLIKPSVHGAVAGERVEEFFQDFESNIDQMLSRIKQIRDIGKLK
ncbi:conserved hypothetical protein [Methanosalsum zhilinae DSM 4017]|uniref:Transcriptional regulator n=1 Tax=Methanosalsum zhilinae (strain DSM 4017 / NBRC 107636 / OCM 62 / WeN5) TaxID=679901 RepID=F7XNR5_METZD|nr:hypothetical protein [Methanosalsum zhilinae]AEH61266.1 conserved hypothetical protein [Methanosalsum zhilinae DSM 4017]